MQSQTFSTKNDSVWCFDSTDVVKIHTKLVERKYYKRLSDSLTKQIFQTNSMLNSYKEDYSVCQSMMQNLKEQNIEAHKIIDNNDIQLHLKDKEIKKQKTRKVIYFILFSITSIIAIAK